MTEADIDAELTAKLVVLRDGARGIYLLPCFIDDARGILEERGVDLPAFDEVFESEDGLEVFSEEADVLERMLEEHGFSVSRYGGDGYGIYEGLSKEARDGLAESY